MNDHVTPRERVECALDTIPGDRTTSISVRDLLFVLKAIREFTSFFWNLSIPDRPIIENFLRASDSQAYDLLREALDKCIRSLPPDVRSDFHDGYFDRPEGEPQQNAYN